MTSDQQIIDQKSPQALIQELIIQLKETERRATDRQPFFRPVTINTHAGVGKKYSAFSRDISASGIGLLHNMPLELEEVNLTIGSESETEVRIRASIEWCESCGEGWYISGGQFLP